MIRNNVHLFSRIILCLYIRRVSWVVNLGPAGTHKSQVILFLLLLLCRFVFIPFPCSRREFRLYRRQLLSPLLATANDRWWRNGRKGPPLSLCWTLYHRSFRSLFPLKKSGWHLGSNELMPQHRDLVVGHKEFNFQTIQHHTQLVDFALWADLSIYYGTLSLASALLFFLLFIFLL